MYLFTWNVCFFCTDKVVCWKYLSTELVLGSHLYIYESAAGEYPSVQTKKLLVGGTTNDLIVGVSKKNIEVKIRNRLFKNNLETFEVLVIIILTISKAAFVQSADLQKIIQQD